jgi:hypothetical protein
MSSSDGARENEPEGIWINGLPGNREALNGRYDVANVDNLQKEIPALISP